MTSMNTWAVETTKTNDWNNHKFHQFMNQSTQQEFLRSQIPFFYAVEAFPRALALLASKIETSEERLLVIENLYEEHGQGNAKKFHTMTFKEFLYALGWNGISVVNPWITDWINGELLMGNEPLSAVEYAAYLAGIEYAYAPISQDIANHVKTLQLKSEQSHYSIHSVLDWEHGAELLTVSETIANRNGIDQDVIKEAFVKGQQAFLKLYNKILFPTAYEMKEINKEPISFYYTREDSSPEFRALHYTLQKGYENPSIMMIGSGGETLIDLLGVPRELDIHVVDMNKNQIDLCKDKILTVLSDSVFSNESLNYSGKFEKVFALVRDFFDYDNKEFLVQHINSSDDGKVKLKYIVDVVFSNDNLSHVFSDRATKYSSDSFAEHFYQVFVTACANMGAGHACRRNITNILNGTDIGVPFSTSDALKKHYHKHKLTYTVGDFETLNTDKLYNVISVSNIGDWMSIDEYKNVLISMKSKLLPNGYIVARKLLGDYDLPNVLEAVGLKPVKEVDTTFFYSEVYLGLKLDDEK